MKKLCQIVLIISAIFMFSLLLSGCAKNDNTILAKIGSDKITAKDLNDLFGRSGINFRSFDEEYQNRKMILDSLIIQQLLIQEAYKKHLDTSEEINGIILASNNKFLLDILYQREIIDKIKVTDAEIKAFYDKLENKVQASHILLTTADTAKIVMDSLKGGANFEDMAVRYSIDPSAKINRGDLGYFTWGRLDPTFQEQAFKLNPGEMSEPFKTRFGWHIVKMSNRAPNELRQSYDKMIPTIRTNIENMKRMELLETFKTTVKDKYPVKVEVPTCDSLLRRRANLYPPQLLETLPKNDFDINQLDSNEREMVLATWGDSSRMTLGQYLTTIRGLKRQYSSIASPDFDQHDSLASFIFQLNIADILALDARKKGLANDAEYKRKIKRFRELAMANIMENDSIPVAGAPDDGEMRQYYESHQDEFKVPAKIHIYEIMFPNEKMAADYRPKIHSLTKFKEIAGQFTERPGKRTSGGDLGYIEEQYYPDIFKLAQAAVIGGITGPIPVGGKFSLIYVADKKAEEIKDFLAVKPAIQENLEKERKQKAFTDWVAIKKLEVSIKIFEDNLKATIDKSKYAPADTTGRG